MMKLKLNSMLLPVAAALILAGCQDLMSDSGGVTKPEDDGRVVYLSTTIALPTATGTRSGTDNTENGSTDQGNDRTNSDATPTDYEYGYDYENDVQSMILLIANEDGKYISHSVVKSIMQAPDGNTNFTFTVLAEIKHSDLAAAYGSGKILTSTASTVNLYAYCNYTTPLLEKLNGLKSGATTWQDFTGEVEEGASPVGHTPEIPHTIWAPRSFLMTNASKFDTKFPSTIEEWSEHADPNKPFDANAASETTPNKPIRVERAAARIDFRAAAGITDNTYPLEVALNDKTDAQAQKLNLFSVQLTRMALVNMSKKFYYLRRVSDDGLNAGSVLGGPETSKNYVVDSDADAKNAIHSSNSSDTERPAGENAITPGNADKHFNFTLFKSADVDGKYPYNIEGWYADKIKTVLDGAEDTWSGSTSNHYHIWRYVTENTIPGAIPGELDNQQTVQSTGVIFKGSIIAGENITAEFTEKIESGSDVDPVRYASPEVELALKAAAQHLAHNPTANTVQKVEDLESTMGTETEFNYPILYSYDGLLYAGVDDLVKAAVRAAERSPLYDAVEKVLNHWYLSYTPLPADSKDNIKGAFTYHAEKPAEEDGKELKPLTVAIYNDILKNKGVGEAEQKAGNSGFGLCTVAAFGTTDEPEEYFMKHAPKEGSEITIYKASKEEGDGEGWGYYCYYFYWNRHNDNLKPGEMGLMEFATVRNNVYKLSVTGIGKLGHPRIPAYDPDPVDPNDPDEEPVNYLKVQVEVLPWVVRVNDIKF